MVLPNKGCGFQGVLVVKMSHRLCHLDLKLIVVLPLPGGQFQLNFTKTTWKNTNFGVRTLTENGEINLLGEFQKSHCNKTISARSINLQKKGETNIPQYYRTITSIMP